MATRWGKFYCREFICFVWHRWWRSAGPSVFTAALRYASGLRHFSTLWNRIRISRSAPFVQPSTAGIPTASHVRQYLLAGRFIYWHCVSHLRTLGCASGFLFENTPAETTIFWGLIYLSLVFVLNLTVVN